MAGAQHFLEITVLPCKNPSNVTKDIKRAVVSGAQKGNGNIIWLFKILGENRILAVVEDAGEAVLDAINEAAGEFTSVTCKALRSYEAFSQNTLGVDAELCGPSPRKLTPGGRIFYMHAHVQYKDQTLETMLKVWHEEATFVLGNRKSGLWEIDAFKIVGSKQVPLFIKADPEVDDALFKVLPLMTNLGDNCEFPTWEVINLLE